MTRQLMYRQGDILIVATTVPPSAAALPPENGRVILARGEATGHAHALQASRAVMFRDDGLGRTFVRIAGDAPASLVHEEHAPIALPPGDYEVIRQREYAPGTNRTVAD